MQKKPPKKSGQRQLHNKVKTAKGRKLSSTRWLQRQLNDPYVAQAKRDGYRCRSSYKLIEIQEKFQLFNKGDTVIDLGCAPGGWCQVASSYVHQKKGDISTGTVIGIDLQEITPIKDVIALQGDFLDETTQESLCDLLPHKVNVVMSDMSPSACGHTQTDHLRSVTLAEEAFYFACKTLCTNGHFITKILQGSEEPEYVRTLQQYFEKVRRFKPRSSRADSTELYIVATNLKPLQ